MEKEIGKVVHYFDKAMVAVIKLIGDLAIGDTVKFAHSGREFTQEVRSMQVEHKAVQSGKAGDEVAVKVNETTHQSAKVYKME